MPTLQQLRYLSAVASTLNFSRAAELCNVTQPTLSLQIRELEDRLGTCLVERSRARVMLTPVGAEIARRARRIADEIDDIRTIARADDPHAMQGVLRMGVVHTVGAYVLSIAMPALRRAYAETRIQVREDRPAALRDHLAMGEYDMLLLPEIPPDAGFETALLMQEALHVVIPRDHRLAGRPTLDIADLAGETVLTMDCGKTLTDEIAQVCRRAGAVQATEYAGTTLDTLRQMVAAGMGISLLPALYVRSEVMREELVVAVPLARTPLSRSICMAWRTSSPRAETYRNVAGLIRDCLGPWAHA
ncbi:hydrogen peroxide-inducible genes activator [Falsirhodobacter halotolerans]|uniref:hydrogen peroxide-inducible genes activator n=1 Tax=Falsirhodobacter halotolerans TaxID=1146892 RepID=UPI001FCF851C|nr:hydrogen peroxide-inducible genes activator [Falsirhodobacter halotolerans]MCJ8140356.1 hydrogen peroxide-inducible genes activator [Falsirhodobacter halotolerans]